MQIGKPTKRVKVRQAEQKNDDDAAVVSFEHLTFGYNEGSTVLKDISF